MKLNKKIMALASATAFGLSGQVYAAGTDAGIDISNEVTLNFTVGGTSQNELKDDTTFKVDNKIRMTLIDNSAGTGIAPGTTETYTFRLKNTGNKAQTFKLELDNTTASTDTDIDIPSSVTYAITNQHFETSTLAADLITMPIDADVTFTAVMTFPTTTNDATPVNIVDKAVYNILATATAVKSDGGAITPDNSTNKNEDDVSLAKEMIVFAESETTDSGSYNGVISVLASTTIATASLGGGGGGGGGGGSSDGPSLTVKVINDPICNADNSGYAVGTVSSCAITINDGEDGKAPTGYKPKAIPGALIEYTITTENSSTTTGANHLQFAHTLPVDEQDTLANVKVVLEGTDVDPTGLGEYTFDAVTYKINNSTAAALAVNLESLPATQTAVITFTAIVK